MTTVEDKAQFYKDLLLRTKCELIFRKVDGSERQGVFTLCPDLIPDEPIKEDTTKPSKVFKDGNVPIYEIETQGWRSFNVERLISFRAWISEEEGWMPFELLP